jgi:hypothetical protein
MLAGEAVCPRVRNKEMKEQKFPKERVDLGSAEDSVKVGTEVLSSLGDQHRK